MDYKVNIEYLGEDVDSPDAKIWKVEAIHVTTTRNKRKFTKAELESAGRSLSFRPLNINHDDSRQLPYPGNSTRAMHFNPATMAVEGSFRVTDPIVNAMIETRRINSVSIEQIPTLGESCNEILCEQHGVAFIGMALLESDVLPGDPGTVNKIVKSESFKELLVSDEQRVCKECSDETSCHKCAHKEFDEILEACLARRAAETPEMAMDVRVVECLEELNRVDSPSFKGITIQLNETLSKIKSESSLVVGLEKYAPKPEMAAYFYKVLNDVTG